MDVLIVSYNTRELLEQCIASIDAHRPPPDRVLLRIRVYDNASTDGSAQMIQARFPAVELTRSTTNVGFGKANNHLAKTSTADYLLLLNSDTIWKSDIVSPLLETLRGDPDAVIAGPRLVYPDGTTQLSSQQAPGLAYELALPLRGTKLRRLGSVWDAERVIEATRQIPLRDSREPRRTEFLWATCWLISRADVERYGLFSSSFPLYDEDLDACVRLRARGRAIVYRPDIELIHVGGASSNPSAKFALMRRARARYYRVHRGRIAAFTYRCGVPLLWRMHRPRGRRTPFAG